MRPFLALLAALAAHAPAAAVDGPALYRRCAACHLPSGAGVPGAFPPLGDNVRGLAGSPAGRRYLVLTVSRGVAGAINVGGRPYRGVMPAQSGLADADIAAVLNHILARGAAGRAPPPFSATEVGLLRRGATALGAAAVARLRP